MRLEVYIKITIVLLVITQILRLIYEARKFEELGIIYGYTIVTNGSDRCWVRGYPVIFYLQNCQEYSAGTVLSIDLQHDNDKSNVDKFSTSEASHLPPWLLLKKSSVKNIVELQPSPFWPLWWRSHLEKLGFQLRSRISSAFSELPQHQQQLAKKTLIGSLQAMDQETNQAIQILGIAHIFAISGFHVSLLSSLLVGITRGASFFKLPSALISGIFLALIAGFSASVLRAGMMIFLVAFSRKFGRSPSLPQILWVCVSVSLLNNPSLLWDIGWQLSYAAVFALVQIKTPTDTVFSSIFTHTIRLYSNSSSSVSSQYTDKKSSSSSTFNWLLTQTLQAGWVSLFMFLWLAPLLLWHFKAISLGGVVSMILTWWLFPLAFSTLLFGSLILTSLPMGLMYQSIHSFISVLFFILPLSLIEELLNRASQLSFLFIETNNMNFLSLTWIFFWGVIFFIHNQLHLQNQFQNNLNNNHLDWYSKKMIGC